MNFDPENILQKLRLRPREKSEEEKRHGTFNRRMIAASIDSLLITGIIAPIVDYFYLQYYGAPDIPLGKIAAQISNEATNSGEATRLFFESLKEAGYIDRMIISTKWQYYAYCVYSVICWHFFSATLGKIICGLKVVDSKTGQKISLWQGTLRAMCYMVSALPLGLGFFWIGFNKKRLGFHDIIAGTMVVRNCSDS